MNITRKPYGTLPDGRAVTEYTLQNSSGASCSILDYGGTITRILVPDRDGRLGDVNLGFDDVAPYERDEAGCMGAVIGRYGNRIGGARFTLEGREYLLAKNNGENNLHGGPQGFNQRLWRAEPGEKDGAPALTLTLLSPDGDMGFPGALTVEATYTFDEENALGITYLAHTDKTTLCNLTNHAYFNLDGHETGTVDGLELQIFADGVHEVGKDLIPTGRVLRPEDTVYGFERPTRLGGVLALTDSDPALRNAGGVDFNYRLGRDRETKVCAILYSPATGREMRTETDQPGVQLYTGQHLNYTGKDGVRYGRFAGLCLETQHYPDSPHQPHFPSVVLRPQEAYFSRTVYRFGIRD
ncbi:MAG: galactose mutarotase [Clostridia bacterium]|nr:galactose mutarotase [Clostridia bacterium]